MIPDRPKRAYMLLLLLLLLVLFFFSFLFCERQIKIIVWSSPVLRLRARPLQTQVATSCDFLQHATVHELGTINITTSCHGIRIIRCISRYIPIYIFLSLSLVTYTLVWHATQKSVSLIIIIVSLLHYTVCILYSSRYKLSHTIAYLPYLPLDFFCSFFFPLQNGEFRPPHSRSFNRSHHLVRSHEHPLWCRTASREENDDDFQGTTNSTCSCKYLPTLLSQCLRRREKEDEDERKRRSWREKWLMLASMHQQTTTSRRHLITQHQKDNK